jgi:hypothetical protein
VQSTSMVSNIITSAQYVTHASCYFPFFL